MSVFFAGNAGGVDFGFGSSGSFLVLWLRFGSSASLLVFGESVFGFGSLGSSLVLRRVFWFFGEVDPYTVNPT